MYRDKKGQFIGGSGKEAYAWKGGVKEQHGYRYIRAEDHPEAKWRGKYIAEHRFVMEKHLGRYLKKGEVVHHINGDGLDNRIENLELFASNGRHLHKELSRHRYVKELPEPFKTNEIIIKKSPSGQNKQYQIRKCMYCKKLYWAIRHSTQRFCSYSCGTKYQWRNNNGTYR